MSTELATVDNLETGLSGDKREIAVTVDRIRAMMPIPDDAPAQAVWGLAQVCVALNLNPLAGEAYLAKFNGKYTPIIGTMGYEKKAREQSDFHYDIEELDEMEMRKHRGSLFDEEDYGVRIQLWHYDQALKCKNIGIPYSPTVTYGFWRMKANEITEWNNQTRRKVSTGEWRPDNIPQSWTKVMVAEKRAVRNAIKRAFSMNAFEAHAQTLGVDKSDEFEARVYEVIEDVAQKEDVRTAPVDHGHDIEEVDGLTVAVRANPPRKPEPILSQAVDELYEAVNPGPDSLEEVEEIQGGEADLPFTLTDGVDTEEEQAIAEDPMVQYHNLWLNPDWAVPDDVNPIFTTIRNADKEGRPTTKKAYGAIVGRLTKLGVGDDSRRTVLAVLFGRTITSEVRPSSAAAKSLYEWLHPDTGDATVKDLLQNIIPMAIGKYTSAPEVGPYGEGSELPPEAL